MPSTKIVSASSKDSRGGKSSSASSSSSSSSAPSSLSSTATTTTVGGLLYISFNQDYGCFAIGTETGFRIYNCSPFKKTCQHDFRPAKDTVGPPKGGIGIVEMLFRCNLLALVGGGKNPRFPPNKVMIWDDHRKKCIGEVKLPRECKAVKMRRDRIIAATENKVYIFRFSDLEMLDFIETCINPKGLFALCPSSTDMILACPGLIRGHVRVEMQLKKSRKSTFIPAHERDLEALALNFSGTRLATASVKGTIIRISETTKGQKLRELRRGVDRAIINSLCFDASSKYVSCCSDKGTIHVFSVKGGGKGSATTTTTTTTTAAPTGNNDSTAISGGGAVEGGDDVDEDQDEEARRKRRMGLAGSSAVGGGGSGGGGKANTKSSLSFMKSMLPKYFSSEWSFAQLRLSNPCAVCAFVRNRDELVIVSADGSFRRAAFNSDGKWTTTDYRELFKIEDDYEFPSIVTVEKGCQESGGDIVVVSSKKSAGAEEGRASAAGVAAASEATL